MCQTPSLQSMEGIGLVIWTPPQAKLGRPVEPEIVSLGVAIVFGPTEAQAVPPTLPTGASDPLFRGQRQRETTPNPAVSNTGYWSLIFSSPNSPELPPPA